MKIGEADPRTVERGTHGATTLESVVEGPSSAEICLGSVGVAVLFLLRW